MSEKYLVLADNGDGTIDPLKWCHTLEEARTELKEIKKLRESPEWDGEYQIVEILERYKPNAKEA